jgi:hypothetical protein
MTQPLNMGLSDSGDDAIHLRDPRSATRTVCDQDISSLNVVAFDRRDVVDWAAGCWGCLTEARDLAAEGENHGGPVDA